jgi:hypothetical protein
VSREIVLLIFVLNVTLLLHNENDVLLQNVPEGEWTSSFSPDNGNYF